MSPQLYVIAGPNGIGKTTSVFDLIPTKIPIINSDEIAEAVRNSGLVTANTQEYSNREAIRLMNGYLQQRSSFAIETNLADLDTWKFLIEIQKSGYYINLVYLSTDYLSLLNSRIEKRVLAGEHFVRPDIVEERYINSLHLLNHYLKMPDHIQLFDNSKSLHLVAEIRKGVLIKTDKHIPQWIQKYLLHILQPENTDFVKKPLDMDSIEDVRKSYQGYKRKTDKLNSKKDAGSQSSNFSGKKKSKPGNKPGL